MKKRISKNLNQNHSDTPPRMWPTFCIKTSKYSFKNIDSYVGKHAAQKKCNAAILPQKVGFVLNYQHKE